MPETTKREEVVVDPEPQVEPEPTPDPPPDDTPPELKGKTPAQIASELRDEKARREAAEETQRRLNDAYVASIMGGTPQPDPEPTLPDPEDDPAAYQEAVVDKKIKEAINQAGAPLAHATQQAAGVAFQTAIDQQKWRMQSNPDQFPDYAELEKDIDQYLGQFPVEQQAAPGAREEIYYRMIGKKRAKEVAEEARRPAIEAGGRSSASREEPVEPVTPKLEDQEARANRERLPDGMFKDMQGPGVMDIDEYMALKEKHKVKFERRN